MTVDEMKENGSKHWNQQALRQVLEVEAEEGFKNIKYPIYDKELYRQAYFAAAEPRESRIKELEDALEYTRKLYGDELEKAYKEINMLRQGYVWQDYDLGEGCYEDSHEGKWVKRWEPWRYVKDELPKIEVGYKVAVEVCYLNVYDNPCKMECDWNGKDFIYQYFDGKTWNFDKKVSLLGKVFAWRYKVDDWPTPSKEEPTAYDAYQRSRRMSNDIFYATYLPPYSGYEPLKLKWWQNVLYTIYSIRKILLGILLFAVWVGLIVLCIKTKYYKWLPACPIGLVVGLLLGVKR